MAVEKEQEDVALKAAGVLRVLGIVAAREKELENAALEAVFSLRDVGKAAAKKKLEKTVFKTAWYIIDIGKATVENKFEDAPYQIALSIAKLTISNEKIINKAFRDYESRLIEKDNDSFKKFMDMYKQELEKLRKNKSE